MCGSRGQAYFFCVIQVVFIFLAIPTNPNCLLFLVTRSSNVTPAGTILQPDRQQQTWCVFQALLWCYVFSQCFCVCVYSVAHLLGEPWQCFISCTYSVSVWWYVWRVPRMCVFSLVCECVYVSVFYGGLVQAGRFWRGPDSCLLLPRGVINSEGGIVIYPFY